MIPGFNKIVEQKIKDAQKEGLFENLPGKGEKIVFENDENIPDELRLAYKLLKNAGFVPPEVELRKEISQVEQLMDKAEEVAEKIQLLKKLNYLKLKLNINSTSPMRIEIENQYAHKLVDKLDSKKIKIMLAT